MDYKVKLSNRALKDIDQTISFLLRKWTITEASNFLNKLDELKNIIKTVAKPLLTKKHDARENINPQQTSVCEDFKFLIRK